MPTINPAALTALRSGSIDSAAPVTRTAPKPEAGASTVPPADKIVLYTSKDTKHKNPLTMTETPGRFVDTKGINHKYETTENPSVFKDVKGRDVFVLGSKEHRAAIATLRDKADRQGKQLRDAPLPNYVHKVATVGAIAGATIGASTLAVPGAIGGAAIGATTAGGAAAAIANLISHRDQFIVRDKIAVLEKTGVLRRAETMRDACTHSGSGKRVALYECAMSILGDAGQIAAEELVTGLNSAAKKTADASTTTEASG